MQTKLHGTDFTAPGAPPFSRLISCTIGPNAHATRPDTSVVYP